MLTGVKEHGKTKCDQYWPLQIDDSVWFDNSKSHVTLKSIEQIGLGLIKRVLRVNNKRTVTHV